MLSGLSFRVSTVANLRRLLSRYCIPMDNDRPSLDLKHFHDICPDKNGTSKYKLMNLRLTWGFCQVPVIAVFTKYDQFRRDVEMKLEDENRDSVADLDAEIETLFKRHYLSHLTGSPPYVRLESEDFVN
jgi:hypothetical protein